MTHLDLGRDIPSDYIYEAWSFERALQAAQEIAKLWVEVQEEEEEGKGKAKKPAAGDGKSRGERLDPHDVFVNPFAASDASVKGDVPPKDSNRWTPYTMEYPHLAAPKRAKGLRNIEEGAILRAPWRLTTDYRIFRDNRARRTGSLLLDASGSMGLTQAMIKQIVERVPAAIVAVYGGNGNSGKVRLVAKGGKMAIAEKAYASPGGANCVDGPGLEWLGLQPLPRIWISDGGVTGHGDQQSPWVLWDAHRICAQFRIRRAGSLAEALRYF